MLLNISQYSGQTLQDQIVAQIRAQILSGELEPDDALPSIRELSERLRVGVNTVQKAYERLIQEKLIYARPKKGFYIFPLAASDKKALARRRFQGSLQALIDDALTEGLSNKEINQLFRLVQSGVNW
jgi:GntR family transcriptional regulator